ncbi:MAG: DUF2191 domain-containing protein [Deltaproteobacteria bacterium]|nr:DUF2191 domain-containing protein [Deltaproteobacteria bacterium]
MRTTLDLNDSLVAKAKALAAKEHTTLTNLIEQGLALRLRSPRGRSSRGRRALPVFAGTGGLTAAVKDSLTHRALLDAVDEGDEVAP